MLFFYLLGFENIMKFAMSQALHIHMVHVVVLSYRLEWNNPYSCTCVYQQNHVPYVQDHAFGVTRCVFCYKVPKWCATYNQHTHLI